MLIDVGKNFKQMLPSKEKITCFIKSKAAKGCKLVCMSKLVLKLKGRQIFAPQPLRPVPRSFFT